VHFLLTPETGYTHFSIGYTDKVGINNTLVKQQHRVGMGSEPFRHLSISERNSMPSLRRRPTRATKPGATGRRVVIYYHRPCALLLMSPRLRRYVPRCCCWRRNFSASNNYEEEGDAQEGKEGATKLFCFWITLAMIKLSPPRVSL